MSAKPKDAAFHAVKLGKPVTYEAVTKWCDDLKWQELNGLLPMGVWRRLAVVNRALYASNRIAEMLVEDARGKDDARDDDRVVYKGFDSYQVEALRLAMIELGSRAEEALGEVRENEYGRHGTLQR